MGKDKTAEEDSFGRTSRRGGPMKEDPKRPGWPKGTEKWAEPEGAETPAPDPNRPRFINASDAKRLRLPKATAKQIKDHAAKQKKGHLDQYRDDMKK